MIEPGELHRYFMVREIATGREVWILGGDTRYELTEGGADGLRACYRQYPAGDYFLAECANRSVPFGRLMRLEEVEPLPDGRGIYAVPDELKLTMTYEGSWRQYADQKASDPAA
jgi:hypothetical protein